MKENDYFICLMCRKVLNVSERKQHLRMHRERNETCAISDSNRKTIIYYKRGYLQDVCREEDATLREKILEEIRKIEEDDIMQQPKALVDINAPVALMQCTREGQIQGLKLALKLLEEYETTNE